MYQSYSVITPMAACEDSILCSFSKVTCPLSAVLLQMQLNMGLKQAGQPSDLNHLVILLVPGWGIGFTSAKLLRLGAPVQGVPQLLRVPAVLVLTAFPIRPWMLTLQKGSQEVCPSKAKALIHLPLTSSLFQHLTLYYNRLP